VYAEIITRRKNDLLTLSNVVVTDAWFQNKSFTDAMLESGFHFISRFWNDVNLKYLYTGELTEKPGRPKKYNGKINRRNLTKSTFEPIEAQKGNVIYTAIVYSISMERNLRLVHLELTNDKEKNNSKSLFKNEKGIIL
jgi:hypothetical protein